MIKVDRSLFPILKTGVYLNHAGVSPLPRPAADQVRMYADEVEREGSAAFSHWYPRMHHSREQAAKLLNAEVSEIAFVKSTTNGLNNVAFGLKWKPDDVIIIEQNTFPANWYPWKAAEIFGAKTWVWPERDFRYDLAELEARLKQGGVRMVAATSANFSTGFRHNLEDISALCQKYGALFCIDAIQTLGVFPLDVKKLKVDFLSADSHKWLLGPEGAGIMYVAKERLGDFGDHIVGWIGRENFQQYHRLDLPPDPTARRFEEGAPNVAGFCAMGESMRLINEAGVDHIAMHNRELCRVLEEGLEEGGWKIISPRDEHASSIVCAQKDGADNDAIVRSLWKEHGILASNRRGFLRMSPHFYETAEEMEKVVEAVVSA